MKISGLLALPCKYPPGKPVHIIAPGHRSHKKKQNHYKIRSQLFIQKHSQKGTKKDRNQHVNSKLPYHCKRLINASVIFHMLLLFEIRFHAICIPFFIISIFFFSVQNIKKMFRQYFRRPISQKIHKIYNFSLCAQFTDSLTFFSFNSKICIKKPIHKRQTEDSYDHSHIIPQTHYPRRMYSP